ncbi:hypothetical protein OROGR_022187 [Orobanche gracilis]
MSFPAFTLSPITTQQLSLPAPPPRQSTDHPDHRRGSTASWISPIAHHCKKGRLSNAVLQFTRMRTSHIKPNHITFVTLISGCAHFPVRGLFLGPSVHWYARKIGLDVGNVMVGTALIDMYSKFGRMGLARLGFDHIGVRNKMQLLGTAPDFVTIISVLSAVANLGALGLGIWTHRFVLMHDFRDNIRISNSLIDMYCRCGCLGLACQVCEKMPNRSIVSWNSIIVGLAYNAYADEALSYFYSMQNDGFRPDGVSFTGALTACSHAGLVEKSLELFKSMTEIHKITPRIEHYGCIVDLYSRAGRLKEALQVLDEMPMKPNEVIIVSLWRDVEIVKIFTWPRANGRWRGASNVRKKMMALGVQKRPGISSIEVNGAIHEFVAVDRSHTDAYDAHTFVARVTDIWPCFGR